jgi:hypothetical protein
MLLVLCGGAAIYFLRARSYEWHEITSSDNRFRLSFPSHPSLLETNETSTDGRPFVSHTLKSSPAERVFYVVSWWENPGQSGQTTEELFAHFRQCAIDVFHTRLVAERDVAIQGYPAKLTFILAGDGSTVENLAIRADGRVYSLSVLDPRATLEKENIQKFFGSFRLEQ